VKDGNSTFLIDQIKQKNSELIAIKEKLETHAHDSQWLIKHYKDQIDGLQQELLEKETDPTQQPSNTVTALSDDVNRLQGDIIRYPFSH